METLTKGGRGIPPHNPNTGFADPADDGFEGRIFWLDDNVIVGEGLARVCMNRMPQRRTAVWTERFRAPDISVQYITS